MSRPPKEQLRIDLLNAFYTAFKAGVDPESVELPVEESIETAALDADQFDGEVDWVECSVDTGTEQPQNSG